MTTKKRYILFGYATYYPSGGAGDEQGRYDTLDDARAAAKNQWYTDHDILDLETGEWVE
jgi:hypothetical protein